MEKFTELDNGILARSCGNGLFFRSYKTNKGYEISLDRENDTKYIIARSMRTLDGKELTLSNCEYKLEFIDNLCEDRADNILKNCALITKEILANESCNGEQKVSNTILLIDYNKTIENNLPTVKASVVGIAPLDEIKIIKRWSDMTDLEKIEEYNETLRGNTDVVEYNGKIYHVYHDLLGE